VPNDDANELTEFMEKAKKNLKGKEGKLVQQGFLKASRFIGRDKSEVLLIAVGQGIPQLEPPKDNTFTSGTYWQTFYRAMTKDQWDSLDATNQLVFGPKDYCGVTDSIECATGFFNGTSGGKLDLKQYYLVQFSVKNGTDAYKHLTDTCPQKGEKEGMSWGLGPQNHAGRGGVYFNQLLKTGTMKFDLISVRLSTSFKRS
jgi:hypothetical protein